jgi:hypothetical protein
VVEGRKHRKRTRLLVKVTTARVMPKTLATENACAFRSSEEPLIPVFSQNWITNRQIYLILRAKLLSIIMSPVATSALPYALMAEAASSTRMSTRVALHERFNRSSLVVGMIVGFFTLFSTLGVNVLTSIVWGENPNRLTLVVFNLAWMAVTSLFAVSLLSMITWMVPDESTRAQIEYCFVVGGILGVGIGWASVDTLLGLQIMDVLPFWIALGGLLGCLCISHRFIDNEEIDDDAGELEKPMIV